MSYNVTSRLRRAVNTFLAIHTLATV